MPSIHSYAEKIVATVRCEWCDKEEEKITRWRDEESGFFMVDVGPPLGWVFCYAEPLISLVCSEKCKGARVESTRKASEEWIAPTSDKDETFGEVLERLRQEWKKQNC